MKHWKILAGLAIVAFVLSGLMFGGYVRLEWWGLMVGYTYCGAMAYFIWIEPSEDFEFLRDWHWRVFIFSVSSAF